MKDPDTAEQEVEPLHRVLGRAPDLFVAWGPDGRLWVESRDAGAKIALPPKAIALLDAFDGRRTVADVLDAVTSPSARAGALRLIERLRRSGYLVEGTAPSAYFSSYEFDSHHAMLRDVPRMEAYARAMERVVRAGDVVADLGAGTGVLSLFACRAGASRVYAIEPTPWIGTAWRVAKANGFSDRIEFIQSTADKAHLPERVDVIVSEWMASWLYQERMYVDVLRARDAWLKPDGRIVPARASLSLAPVDMHDVYEDRVERWDGWMSSRFGLTFAPLRPLALQEAVTLAVPAGSLLSRGAVIHDIDMATAAVEAVDFESRASFVLERDGNLHGLAGWFTAQLSSDVLLSTAPDAAATHWRQQLFLLPAMKVRAGDVLCVDVTVRAAPSDARRLGVTVGYTLERENRVLDSGHAVYPEV